MSPPSEETVCPVCKLNHAESRREAGFRIYECPNCGFFRLDDLSSMLLKSGDHDERTHAILSHWIRRQYDASSAPGENPPTQPVKVDKSWIKQAEQASPEKPAQQLNNLIEWMGDNMIAGQEMTMPVESFLAVTGSTTPDSFGWVLKSAIEKNLIDGIIPQGMEASNSILNAYLTIDGWSYYEELKTTSHHSNKAFMAMPFGNDELNKIVDEVFKPAVAATGYDLRKATDEQPAGLIDDQIRVRIRTSKFVICDLSDDNAGAYWEAGFAEGAGIPVIYTCEKSKFDEEKTHFDTNHLVTVPWDAANPEKAAEALKNTIRATFFAEAVMSDDQGNPGELSNG